MVVLGAALCCMVVRVGSALQVGSQWCETERRGAKSEAGWQEYQPAILSGPLSCIKIKLRKIRYLI